MGEAINTSRHDDQVDVLAYAAMQISKKRQRLRRQDLFECRVLIKARPDRSRRDCRLCLLIYEAHPNMFVEHIK